MIDRIRRFLRLALPLGLILSAAPLGAEEPGTENGRFEDVETFELVPQWSVGSFGSTVVGDRRYVATLAPANGEQDGNNLWLFAVVATAAVVLFVFD